MQLKITWQYSLAFMAFVFVFGQLHEMAHLVAARIVCGEPGIQHDFNLWTLSNNCNASPYSFIPTIFGPLFSYICMWAGFFLLRADNRESWPLAFVLVIGNLAFARIFTASMGGGDETTVLKVLFQGLPIWLIKFIGFVLVFSLAFPPLFAVYKRLANKYRLRLLTVFCIVPLIVMMLYEFMLLGKVLKARVLVQSHFLGIADFIHWHTLLMAVIVIIFRKTLFGDDSLAQHNSN